MTAKARTMLESMYDLLNNKFSDRSKAWDSLVEFLAIDNCPGLLYDLNHKFEWLFEDKSLAGKLLQVYDAKLLREDYYDHLGEMYLDKIVPPVETRNTSTFSKAKNIGDMVSSLNIASTDRVINILDPAASTGRLLMAAHMKTPNASLFGVDTDLRALRIAFTNFAIHNVKGYLLNANSLLHEVDIATEDGQHNWNYANKWYSCQDKLRPVQIGDKAGLIIRPRRYNQSDFLEK